MSSVTVLPYSDSTYNGPPNVVLRIYCLYAFITSDGLVIQAGSPGSSAFYKSITCSVTGTTLTIPTFDIDSTTDALNLRDRQLAGYGAFFYTTQGKLISVFQPYEFFRVTPTPNPTSWNDIALFMAPLPPLNVDLSSFYTKEQVDAKLPGGGGGVPITRQVNTGTGLQGGGDLSVNRTHSLTNTGVTPGSYTSANLTVDPQGRLTSVSSGGGGGTVTQVNTGTGLTGGPITASGTVALANTAVTPGSYTNLTATVDAQGRLTSAVSGSAGNFGSDFELEQFGGAADGVTDNFPAWTAFIAHLASNSITGATLRLREGRYNSSGEWFNNYQLRIVGAGPSTFALGTHIYFYNFTKGIINGQAGENADGTPGAVGSIYENLTISGTIGNDGTCNTLGNTVTRVSGPPFTSFHPVGCTINIAGYNWGFAVVDADHLTVAPVDMLVSGDGVNNVGRLTGYEFAPYLVGATFDVIGGSSYTVISVNDIGNLKVTPNHNIGTPFYGTLHGYLGTQTGVNYFVNYRHGIELHSRATIRNCTVINFAGIGICADSQRPIPNAGCNINLLEIQRTRVAGNYSHGFFAYGNDANAGNMLGLDCSDNKAFGIYDISFLGNDYYGPHTIGNFWGGYNAGAVGLNHSQFFGPYQEDDQVGFYGNAGVMIYGGTVNNIHPASIAQSFGSVATGNFLAAPLHMVQGQGIRTSANLGALTPLRDVIKDTGTFIQISDGAVGGSGGYYTLVNSDGQWAGGLLVAGSLDVGGHILTKNKAGDPTTTDIPAGRWSLWKNTTSGITRLWTNDSGVMKAVTLS